MSIKITTCSVREFFKGRNLSKKEETSAKSIRSWGWAEGTDEQVLIAYHLENMMLWSVSVTQTSVKLVRCEFTATTTTTLLWFSTYEVALEREKALKKKIKESVKAHKALVE